MTEPSKFRIPVGDMARSSLDKLFPQLTADQVTAIREGRPVPPSPDWKPLGGAAIPAWEEFRRQAPDDRDALIQRLTKERDELSARLDMTRVRLYQAARMADIAAAAMRNSLPGITALLVFSDAARLKRARKAVNQFVAQSYPNKQLIIVNDSRAAVTNVPHPLVREIFWNDLSADRHPTTGKMRNFGYKLADTPLVFPFWDDDDVYDPHLLAYMAVAGQGRKTILTTQVRVDIDNSTAYLHTDPAGIPNTVLLPGGRAELPFPDQTGGEDVESFETEKLRSGGPQADYPYYPIDNSAWPANTLLMRVWDGNNVSTCDEFMGAHAAPAHRGRWDLGPNEAAHMKAVLATFGVRTTTEAPTDPATT